MRAREKSARRINFLSLFFFFFFRRLLCAPAFTRFDELYPSAVLPPLFSFSVGPRSGPTEFLNDRFARAGKKSRARENPMLAEIRR